MTKLKTIILAAIFLVVLGLVGHDDMQMELLEQQSSNQQ